MSDNKPKVGDVRKRAEGEGLLDVAVIKLPVSRWPQWARIRYSGDDVPASGPEKAAEPLRVEDL